jgi:hypothetical protein
MLTGGTGGVPTRRTGWWPGTGSAGGRLFGPAAARRPPPGAGHQLKRVTVPPHSGAPGRPILCLAAGFAPNADSPRRRGAKRSARRDRRPGHRHRLVRCPARGRTSRQLPPHRPRRGGDGRGPWHRSRDRTGSRERRRRRRIDRANARAARRGRGRDPRCRPARGGGAGRRQRHLGAAHARGPYGRRARPSRCRRQQRWRHRSPAAPRDERGLPRALLPLQRHDCLRIDQACGAAPARHRRGRGGQHLLDDGPAARPGLRRLRHGEGRTRAHDAPDGRRPRASRPRQRDRGRLRRHLGTGDRPDGGRPARRDDPAHTASPSASYVTGKVVEVDGGLEEPNLELGLPDL